MDEATESVTGDVAATPSDEYITKEQATKRIKLEKEAAYRKAEREFQAQLEQLKSSQAQQSMGGMTAQVNPEEIATQAAERAKEALEAEYKRLFDEHQKKEYETYVNDQARMYLEKMDKGSGIAEDFKEMTSRFKPEKFKEIFFLANSYENTPAIIYELSKYPQKLLEMDRAMERDPELAKVMMDSLVESIKFNEQALQNNRVAEPPLGRPKPSLATGTDSGAMSLADLKKAPWLRG